MPVSAFLDESGKFQDKDVTSIGCVAAMQDQFKDFTLEWQWLLRRNGLEVLSGKEVLNPNKPLSDKNACYGLDKRTETLLPFIKCIRKHMQVITGMVADAKVFKSLPPHFFQVFGEDPIYMSFGRTILHVLEFVPDNERIVLTLDEDEQTLENLYRLYKKIKKTWPKAKKHLAAISFADDRYLSALQAADFIGALMRLEFDRKWNNAEYDYPQLWTELTKPPDSNEGRLWYIGIGLGDKDNLRGLADDLLPEWKRLKNESEKE